MLKFNAVTLLTFIYCLVTQITWSAPKNVIFFIGDGMAFEQVKAAGMYAYGEGGTLSFETLPRQAEATTYSANSSVTDSAAAGTALATGFKVNNGVISMAYPGDRSELCTLLEYFRDKEKSTGLVTTTYITHATPAAFGAHEPDRNNLSQIAVDYLNQTRPNVLFGGGANGMSPASAAAAGYTVVTDRASMQALYTEAVTMVSGQFGSTYLPYEYDGDWSILPHLSEMTETALAILDNDWDGFFLMVEGGLIDQAGHSNHIERNVFETIEFSNAVQVALDWAQGKFDTLIIVTADHETGGLTVLQNNGQGIFPTVTWNSANHTGANVPVYAWGVNAELVSGVMDNTDLFEVATIDITYYIRGYVRDPGGKGIGGVTMKLSGDTSKIITTDANGNYEFSNLPLGNYTLTSSKSDWYFSPISYAYSPLNGNKDNQNFVMTYNPIPTDKVYAYPNPARKDKITIHFSVFYPEPEMEILIYNISGELVRRIPDEDISKANAPIYEYSWNTRNKKQDRVGSGIYLYLVRVRDKSTGESAKVIKKLAIIR